MVAVVAAAVGGGARGGPRRETTLSPAAREVRSGPSLTMAGHAAEAGAEAGAAAGSAAGLAPSQATLTPTPTMTTSSTRPRVPPELRTRGTPGSAAAAALAPTQGRLHCPPHCAGAQCPRGPLFLPPGPRRTSVPLLPLSPRGGERRRAGAHHPLWRRSIRPRRPTPAQGGRLWRPTGPSSTPTSPDRGPQPRRQMERGWHPALARRGGVAEPGGAVGGVGTATWPEPAGERLRGRLGRQPRRQRMRRDARQLRGKTAMGQDKKRFVTPGRASLSQKEKTSAENRRVDAPRTIGAAIRA